MSTAGVLAELMDGSRAWTLKLVEDVRGDEWTYQPGPGLHHILWLCGHLATAEQTLVMARCLGGDGPDADFAVHFPIGGAVKSAAEHEYPAPGVVLERMAATHARVMEEIRGISEAKLASPCFGKDGAPHPHYSTVAGAISHCARHEGFHAGQIALLRRLMGKAFIR